jgi:hypothetical protein
MDDQKQRIPTAWMWLDGSDIRGLSIDVESRRLHWYDVVGCHCSDEETIEQSLESYRQEGAPPYVGPVPADIAAEIEIALGHL